VRPPIPAAALLLLLPQVAPAQAVAARAIAASIRTTTATAGPDRRLSGSALGFEGGIGLTRVQLMLRYAQGSVRNDSSGVERDFAEGDLTLWARPFAWAAVGVGPHIRSFIAPGSTERWLFWEARARGSTTLLPAALEAYLEGWLVLAGDVDVPEPFNAGRGVEGGLALAVGRLPLGVRLRYRVERIALGEGARRETTEHLTLGVGIGRL
jgi:hypothetical protein